MDEPMNYALIGEDGVVNNIIWLCSANRNDFASAICVANRPVAIGDIYQNGVFRRDGEEVLSYPDQIASLAARIAELEAQLEG